MERISLAREFLTNEEKILKYLQGAQNLLAARSQMEKEWPTLIALRTVEVFFPEELKVQKEKRERRKKDREEKEKLGKAVPAEDIRKPAPKRKEREEEESSSQNEAKKKLDKLSRKASENPSSSIDLPKPDNTQNF